MDSKIVNKAIKQHIFPLLKSNGFEVFTQRTAWRYGTNKIDVINFQSFNSYLAGSLGCTTFSFGVNLGIYFKDIPNQFPGHSFKERAGYPCPQECECHFRKPLLKKLQQIDFSRKDIWYIDPEGTYLELSLNDVKQELESSGLTWFQRYEDMNMVLRTLLEDNVEIFGTHGFGRNPSPIRSYQTGYIALSIGNYKLAKKALKDAIDSNCFKIDRLKTDYESINSEL